MNLAEFTSCVDEVGFSTQPGHAIEGLRGRSADRLERPGAGATQLVLELGEERFDRVLPAEILARPETAWHRPRGSSGAAPCLYGLPILSTATMSPRRRVANSTPRKAAKAFTVDRAVDQPGSVDAVLAPNRPEGSWLTAAGSAPWPSVGPMPPADTTAHRPQPS
jgi:hypothetical protein